MAGQKRCPQTILPSVLLRLIERKLPFLSNLLCSRSGLRTLTSFASIQCSGKLDFSEKHSFLPVWVVACLLQGSSRVELQRCRLVQGEGREVLDLGFGYLNVQSTYRLSYHYPDDIPDDLPEQGSDDLSEDQSDDHVNGNLVLYTAFEPST
jgi:hypothetical protein